jgi:hypothetical protein
MGMEILSSILQHMSYPNMVLSKNDDDSEAVEVRTLHNLLLKVKGCLKIMLSQKAQNFVWWIVNFLKKSKSL